MTEECPHCNTMFDSERGLSIHRTAIHNERSEVEIECENCGETKTLTESKANRGEHSFCSKKCYGEWISGENHPKWNREEVSCSYCGETKKVTQRDIKRNKEHFFCDTECCAKWQSENRWGKDHPAWKDDANVALDYGENWTRMRQDFIEESEDKCYKCDSPKDKLDVDLHVHHIIRPERFNDIDKAHESKNLLRLCRKCHPVVENLSIEKQFNYHPESDGEWVEEVLYHD